MGDIKVNEIKTDTIKNQAGTSAISINSSGVVTQPAKPMFQVGLSAHQAIATATDTKVTWNDVQTSSGGFNIGNHFDTSNNRFNPSVSGYYHIIIQLRLESTTPDFLVLYIRKNGSTIRQQVSVEGNAQNSYVCLHTSTIVHMNGSSDYIETVINHNVGSTTNLVSNYGHTQFGGYLIG
tara:strand:- start:1003 stop:1539 length:537 start_codon:yes stop_codon:yes gene_type:complete